MANYFLHYLETYRLLTYTVIFIALLFEGELVLFGAMFLAHQKFIDFGDLIWISLSSILIGDFLWYNIGIYVAGKQNRFTRLANKASQLIGKSLTTRPLRTLLIGKFTYGLHRPTLIAVGMNKFPLKKFLQADLLVAGLWFLIIGSVAFLASSSLLLARHYLKYAEFTLLIAVIGWFLVEQLTKKILKNKN